uniref:Ig-like domain-containing protein n=1 Tax=Astyanax mexicanus TaxID=7994 RepID=A0A8B9RH95_ASTMX
KSPQTSWQHVINLSHSIVRRFLILWLIRSTIQDSEIKPVVPATVEVCSGSNATINCTFTTDSEGLKIRWHFNSSSRETKIYHNDEHYDRKNEKTWSALTIKEVTFNDSGLYYCVVIQDIPILKEYYSNGSQLNIHTQPVLQSSMLQKQPRFVVNVL